MRTLAERMEAFEKGVDELALLVEYNTGWDPFGRSAEEQRVVREKSYEQCYREITGYFREMAEVVCHFEEALRHKDNMLDPRAHFHAMALAKIAAEKLTR